MTDQQRKEFALIFENAHKTDDADDAIEYAMKESYNAAVRKCADPFYILEIDRPEYTTHGGTPKVRVIYQETILKNLIP